MDAKVEINLMDYVTNEKISEIAEDAVRKKVYTMVDQRFEKLKSNGIDLIEQILHVTGHEYATMLMSKYSTEFENRVDEIMTKKIDEFYEFDNLESSIRYTISDICDEYVKSKKDDIKKLISSEIDKILRDIVCSAMAKRIIREIDIEKIISEKLKEISLQK